MYVLYQQFTGGTWNLFFIGSVIHTTFWVNNFTYITDYTDREYFSALVKICLLLLSAWLAFEPVKVAVL